MRKIIFAALLCLMVSGAAGTDIQKLVQDTQRVVQKPSEILMVWWIPVEFWDAVLKDNPKVTDDAKRQLHDSLNSYMVFVVIAMDVGPMGGMTPRARATTEAQTQFIVDGKSVPLVAAEELNADAMNFVSMMKPMMANMLGQFGRGFEILLYPNPAKKGAAPISALQKGSFTYVAYGNRFDWRLPVGSLLPAKVDPRTREEFPGDYNFNPLTGEKLVTKATQKP